jgi:phage terminase small subunit
MTLTGNTFTRSDMGGQEHAGVIAQEVQKVLPEAVNTSTTDEEIENKLSVSLSAMVGLLVESANEDRKLIDLLRQQVDTLLKESKNGNN